MFVGSNLLRCYFVQNPNQHNFDKNYSICNNSYTKQTILNKTTQNVLLAISSHANTLSFGQIIKPNIEINYLDLANLIGVQKNKAYKDKIINSCLDIHNSNIVIKDKRLRVTLEAKFAKKYLSLNLSSHFIALQHKHLTKLNTAMLLRLNSPYSIKLFGYISTFKNKEQIFIKTSTLLELLNLEPNTPKYRLNEILKRATKELNISYEVGEFIVFRRANDRDFPYQPKLHL